MNVSILEAHRTDSRDCGRKVHNVWREDRGLISSVRRTDEGYLILRGYAAKPGVMEYRQADGSVIRELVLPEDLHDPASLDTLRGKPTTLEHPAEDVTPDNVHRYGTGDVPDVRVDPQNGYLDVETVIRRRDAIQAYDSGEKVELSPGYWVLSEDSPGVHPEYGPYDRIQRSRRYNHLAQVSRARGGPDIRLRTDSAGAATMVDRLEAPPKTSKRNDNRTTRTRRKMKGKALQALLIGFLHQKLSRNDAIEMAIENGADRSDAIEAYEAVATEQPKGSESDRIDALIEAKLDKLLNAKGIQTEKPKTDSQESAGQVDPMAFYKERQRLDAAAKAVGLELNAETEAMGNTELRKAIVLKARPQMRQDGDDAYYAAAFDVLGVELAAKADSNPGGGTVYNNAPPAPADPWAQLGQPSKQRTDGNTFNNDSNQKPDILPSEGFLANLGPQRN